VFVVGNFCSYFAKFQTAITFALVIEIGQIFYAFGVEFNFIFNRPFQNLQIKSFSYLTCFFFVFSYLQSNLCVLFV